MSILGRVYRDETVTVDDYGFDDGAFSVPPDGDYDSYIEHCKVLQWDALIVTPLIDTFALIDTLFWVIFLPS